MGRNTRFRGWDGFGDETYGDKDNPAKCAANGVGTMLQGWGQELGGRVG